VKTKPQDTFYRFNFQDLRNRMLKRIKFMPSTIVSVHLPVLITRVFGKRKQTTVIIKEFSPC